MYITNNCFIQDRRRQYMWMKPGDTRMYQTDNILTECRYWNSVCNSKAYTGADLTRIVILWSLN